MLLVHRAPLYAQSDLTCKLKGGNQQADYHCPEHFNVVIAGEDTDRCDGACYKVDEKDSLRGALKEIMRRRLHEEPSDSTVADLADRLESKGYYMKMEGKVPDRIDIPKGLDFRVAKIHEGWKLR